MFECFVCIVHALNCALCPADCCCFNFLIFCFVVLFIIGAIALSAATTLYTGAFVLACLYLVCLCLYHSLPVCKVYLYKCKRKITMCVYLYLCPNFTRPSQPQQFCGTQKIVPYEDNEIVVIRSCGEPKISLGVSH